MFVVVFWRHSLLPVWVPGDAADWPLVALSRAGVTVQVNSLDTMIVKGFCFVCYLETFALGSWQSVDSSISLK